MSKWRHTCWIIAKCSVWNQLYKVLSKSGLYSRELIFSAYPVVSGPSPLRAHDGPRLSHLISHQEKAISFHRLNEWINRLRNQQMKWKFSSCISHLQSDQKQVWYSCWISVLKRLIPPLFPPPQLPICHWWSVLLLCCRCVHKVNILESFVFFFFEMGSLCKLKILLPQASECWSHNIPSLHWKQSSISYGHGFQRRDLWESLGLEEVMRVGSPSCHSWLGQKRIRPELTNLLSSCDVFHSVSAQQDS